MVDWPRAKSWASTSTSDFPAALGRRTIRPTTGCRFWLCRAFRADKESTAHVGLDHTAFEYECFYAGVALHLRFKDLGIEPDVYLNNRIILLL